MAQVFTNAVIAASIYALVGVAFSARLSSARFFDFSAAIFFTLGPYLALAAKVHGGVPTWAAGVCGVVTTAGLGVLAEVSLFRPLRRRGGDSLVQLVLSLAVYIVGQNLVSSVFGDGLEPLLPGAKAPGFVFLGTRIGGVHIATLAVTGCGLLLLHFLLRRTRLGLEWRAVAANPSLAVAAGTNVQAIELVGAGVAASMCACAGVLQAADVGMTPLMGLPVVLAAVAVVVVAGRMNMAGIAGAGLMLAILQQLVAWVLGAKWMDGVAFSVLLVFLVLRAGGVLRNRVRAGDRDGGA